MAWSREGWKREKWDSHFTIEGIPLVQRYGDAISERSMVSSTQMIHNFWKNMRYIGSAGQLKCQGLGQRYAPKIVSFVRILLNILAASIGDFDKRAFHSSRYFTSFTLFLDALSVRPSVGQSVRRSFSQMTARRILCRVFGLVLKNQDF